MMSQFCSAGIAAALLFAATACQDNFERAEVYAQEARTLYEAGDREGAYRAIQSAIRLRDDNASYFILLGAIEMRMNSPVDAYVAFTRALELDEANIEALTYVSNIGLQVGRVDEASATADRLLSLNPNSIVGLQVKGLAEMFRNRDAEAARYADRILQISPRDEAGTIIRARLLAKQGRLEEGLEMIDRTLQNAPATPGLLVTKINLYRSLRRPEPMAETFDQLFELIPNAAAGLQLDRINLLYKLGRTEEARKAVIGLLSSGQVELADYQVLVRIWSEFDSQPFTRESLEAAAGWPDPVGLIVIGRYMLWQGHPQLADDAYFSYLPGIRPAAGGVHRRAGALLGTLDNNEAGVETLLDRDPEDVDALILYAQGERDRGNLSLAIESMQKAVEVDPLDPEAYAVLAELREKAGAERRASQVFEDGLRRLPQDFLLVDRYLEFLHRTDNKSRAVSVARSFARALPSSTKAWEIYQAECKWSGMASCRAEAEAGLNNARTVYQVDEVPGAPADRGLLSKFAIQDA